MGRLTLNVLLSFAQFEREVTGERIRDKIAASKRKGMWMGGNGPKHAHEVGVVGSIDRRQGRETSTGPYRQVHAGNIGAAHSDPRSCPRRTVVWAPTP
jgi:DNA invertase Pin-like site-specific DNA recombinase